MNGNRVIAGGIAAAIVLSGAVMVAVRGPALTGLTPVETAIFAIVGVGRAFLSGYRATVE